MGNAAGDGCRIALLNRDKRVEADWIADNIQYMELTLEENFQWQLMEAIHLPHMTDAFDHLDGILSGSAATSRIPGPKAAGLIP